MPRALLVIYGPSDGTELLRVAHLLRADGWSVVAHLRVAPAQLMARVDPAHVCDLDLLDYSGRPMPPIERVRPVRQPDRPAAAPRQRSLWNWAGRIERRARDLLVALEARFVPFARWRLYRQLRALGRVLTRVAPDIVILPLESLGHHSGLVAAAARRAGLPVVVVPYSVPVNVAELTEALIDKPDHKADRTPLGRRLARRAPEWIYTYRHTPLLRVPAVMAQAYREVGLAPARPWAAGGLRFANRIAVENDASLAQYLAEGFPPDRLTVTGTLVDDVLATGKATAAERKSVICRELGLPSDRPIALAALPPDFTHRAACDFDSVDSYARFWFAALGALQRYSVIVRPHPEFVVEELRQYEPTDALVRVCGLDTAELVPLADLYIACVSATIRWAIALGLPVVNYDMFRFGYDDFADAGGVLHVADRDEFVATLRRLDVDPAAAIELARAQASCAGRWGRLDGGAGARLLTLLRGELGAPGGAGARS